MAIQTLSLEEASMVSGGGNGSIPLVTQLVSGSLVQAVLDRGFVTLGAVFRNRLLSGLVEGAGGTLNRLLGG